MGSGDDVTGRGVIRAGPGHKGLPVEGLRERWA